jgi:hypothetical protein
MYYSHSTTKTFASILKKTVQEKGAASWHFSLLDAATNVRFYLHLSPDIKNYGIVGLRDQQTVETLMKKWPTLKNIPPNTILVTRKVYQPVLQPYLKKFTLIEAPSNDMQRWFHRYDPDAPIAFIPNNTA